MEHYVTLFDSLFLPQGLALHRSLERHAGEYTLWVLCMDADCHTFLSRLDLPNLRLLELARLETDALRAVKPGRSVGEYCWTLTPFAPRFVFEADASVERVTYLDADLWFRKNPAPLFRELEVSGKAVLITDHGYAAEYDLSAVSGQYCVQFVTFVRERSEKVRAQWEAQCLEWCFARAENGKFGDQKYLDEWPDVFSGLVHVLADKELTQAPWNATRFPYGHAIFWHFHSLRILGKKSENLSAILSAYPLPAPVRSYVYAPYLEDLRYALSRMRECGVDIRPQGRRSLLDRVMALLRGVYYQLWRFDLSFSKRL